MLILGTWLWHDEAGFAFHGPPSGCRAAIDLTPPTELQKASPGTPRGIGLFEVTEVPRDGEFVILANEDLREARSDQRARDAWAAWTGYRPQGDTFGDLLWDQLTAGSDPAGIDRPSPLVPRLDGWLQLWFGGARLRQERFEWGRHSHTTRVRDLLARELLSCRDAAHSGELRDTSGAIDFERHRRVADALCSKYGVSFEDLRPLRWPESECRLPHETTIADNFNRANGSLGTSSEGWNWAGLAGTMQIASNRATVTLNAARYRAEVDLSSSDNESRATVTLGASNVEMLARYQPGADTCYRSVISVSQVRIFKTVNGNQTQVGTTTLATWPAVPFTIGMRCNGSTLDALVNGVSLKNIASDTSIVSGTRCGMGGSGGTAQTYDDWSASDLVAGSVLLHSGMSGRFRQLTGGMQG